MMRGKKGFGLGMTDWGSLIVFGVIFIVTFIFFDLSFGRLDFRIDDTTQDIGTKIELINILKTPVKLGDANIKIGKLFLLYSGNKEEYGKVLSAELEPILEKGFPGACVEICIDKEFFASSKSCNYPTFECEAVAVQLPSSKGTMEISLHIESKEFESII